MAAGHPVEQYGLLWVHPLLNQSSFPRTHPTWNRLFFDRNLRYFRTCAVGAKRLSQDVLFIDLRECFGDLSTGRAHAIVAKRENEAALKSAGKLRLEGKDYVMQDRDVAESLVYV